jgi:hypothetical protein
MTLMLIARLSRSDVQGFSHWSQPHTSSSSRCMALPIAKISRRPRELAVNSTKPQRQCPSLCFVWKWLVGARSRVSIQLNFFENMSRVSIQLTFSQT